MKTRNEIASEYYHNKQKLNDTKKQLIVKEGNNIELDKELIAKIYLEEKIVRCDKRIIRKLILPRVS